MARRDLVTAGLIAAASLVLYVATASRDIVAGDSAELVSVAATLGVAHPPGYPLFTLLGHLAALLPLGSIPFRVDLLSAVLHAATVGLVFVVARRASGDLAGSALAALVLALAPFFWGWSLVTEVFPLNDVVAIAALALTIRWENEPRRGRWLVAAALCFGLGLANQLTIALIAPAILLTLWRRRGELVARPAIVVASAAALAAGLLPYAYLPLAAATHPIFNWTGIASFDDFVRHVLRQQYGSGQLIAGNAPGGSLLERLGYYGSSFSPVEAVLLVVGAAGAWRFARAELYRFAIAFLFTGPLFVAYANADVSSIVGRAVIERFFLLSHVVAAPLMAFAPRAVTSVGSRWAGATVTRRSALGVGAAAAVLAATLSLGATDRRDDHITRSYAEDVLATLEPGSILLVHGDHVVFPIEYLQVVEGARPDVTVVILSLLYSDWYVRQLHERYPALVVPFTVWDGQSASLTALIDANPGHEIAVQPDITSDGNVVFGVDVGRDYEAHGLLLRLVPRGAALDPAAITAQNTRLLSLYRPPSPDAVRRRSWERLYLADYGLVAYRVGRLFELAQVPAEARRWYARALTIDPELPEAQRGLARLPR